MLFHSCLPCLGEVIEHIAVLLAQRIADGEHALDESATGRTVGAEAGMAPQDAMPQGPFCRVVGGLEPSLRTKVHSAGSTARRLAQVAAVWASANCSPHHSWKRSRQRRSLT